MGLKDTLGEQSIEVFGELGFVSSGLKSLNWCISDRFNGGGFPKGRVVELFGDPSSGKSLLLYSAMAEVQKQEGIAILDDVEKSLPVKFARTLGMSVDTDKDFIYLSSRTVEEHHDAIVSVVNKLRAPDSMYKDAPIVVGLDSVAVLSTTHEVKSKIDVKDMTKAQIVRKIMRLLDDFFWKNKVLYIVCNHTIANIGGFGTSYTVSSGTGIIFQSAVRVETSILKKIKNEEGLIVGVKTLFSVPKNKICPPFRECVVDVYFEKGLDDKEGILDILAIIKKLGKKSGGWYVMPNGDSLRSSEVNTEELLKILDL